MPVSIKPSPKPNTRPKKVAQPKPEASTAPPEVSAEEFARARLEAQQLETRLEGELLRDAILTARMALEELHTDTHGPPYERRRGIRLREKAIKVERAFNRLRALRLGLLLPITEDD